MEKKAIELLNHIKNDNPVDDDWFINIRDEIDIVTDNDYNCSDELKEEILSYAEYIYLVAGAIKEMRKDKDVKEND